MRQATDASHAAADDPADAAARRRALAWVDWACGALPPAPDRSDAVLLHRAPLARAPGATLESWQLVCGSAGDVAFVMQLLRPAGAGPHAVVLSGDACWPYLDDAVKSDALQCGIALAWFNRTELAADPPPGVAQRASPLQRRHPGAGFGALSAWAWGLQRAVDAVERIEGLDAGRIALAGHSRGGKAALIAGALDRRVALTAANNAGTLGAALHSLPGEGAETLAQLAQAYPHWVGPGLAEGLRRGEAPPFDQDDLLAAIAPRGLLLTQARDDAWAHPQGVRLAVDRIRGRWTQAGRGDAIGIVWRDGGHPQQRADWRAVFDRLRRGDATPGRALGVR